MTSIKKTAIALSFIVLSATTSFATPVSNVIATEKNGEEPFAIKFMGEENGYLLFQVSFKTTELRKASFIISDKNEGEIYNEVLINNKTQLLKIEKRDNQELSFNLQIGKESFSKSFVVVPTVVLSKL